MHEILGGGVTNYIVSVHTYLKGDTFDLFWRFHLVIYIGRHAALHSNSLRYSQWLYSAIGFSDE